MPDQPNNPQKTNPPNSITQPAPSNITPKSVAVAKKKSYFMHHVSPVATALSIKHFATMLKSGLALDQILEILAEQNIDPMLSDTYAEVLIEVRSGKTIAQSMRNHPKIFSEIVVSIVEIGERGATLEKNLNYLSEYLRDAYELQKKIKGAMTYPLIVLAVTALEMVGVFFFIIPKLENLFKAFDDPPATTMAIINFSKFFRANIVPIVVIFIIIFVVSGKYFKTKSGKHMKDRIGLKFPVFKKLNKSSTIASFSRTLGILLESGIPISEGLHITAETTQNSVYATIVQAIEEKVKKGNLLSASLSDYPKYFPNTFIKMIEVGETTGTLESNLGYLHEFYTEEVKDIANNLTTLLEPMLMIFIGVMIGALAIAVILPIYQLIGSINS